MAENPFMNLPKEKKPSDAFGFMTPFIEGATRGLAQRGIGLIQGGMELSGADKLYPETYAQSQRTIDRLRNEGVGTGAMGVAGEIMGDPLTAVLAPLGVAGTIPKMALTGAGIGAAEGLTGGIGEGESRAYETLKSTAGGAVLAPVAGKGMELTASSAAPVMRFIANKVDDVSNLAGSAMAGIRRMVGNLDDDVVIGIKSGITPDDFQSALADISDDAVKAFKGATAKGVDPRAAYLDEVFKAKGGKMTAGQLGQDPNLQRLEDYARQGLLSGKAKNLARASEEQNMAAMRDWSSDILRKFGVDATDIDQAAVGGRIATGFESEASRLKGLASEAYKAGAKTTARVPTSEFSGFTSVVRRGLVDDGFDIGGLPTVQRTINQLTKAEKVLAKASDGTAAYKPFEVFRKRLVQNVENAGTPAERAALARIRDEYTSKLEDVIGGKLINGGDDAARILRQAPGLWREYKQSIFGADGKAALGKIVSKDMSDRQVAEIFGSSAFGKGDTQKVVNQLGRVLGKDSPEFGAVQGMFFNRLTNNALTSADDIGSKGFGVALKSNWQKMKTKDKALVNELYTPDMQRQIDDFVDAAFLQSNKIKSGTNPSGSGIALMDGWLRMMQSFGQGGGMMRDAAIGIAKAATTASDSRAAIKSMTNAMSLLGDNSNIIRDGLTKAGVIGGGQATGKFAEPQKGFDSQPMIDTEQNPFMNLQDSNPFMMDEQSSIDLPDTREREGLRFNSYMDTTGNRTVGYGFNMDSGIAKNAWNASGIKSDFDAVYRGEQQITPQEAESLFAASSQVAVNDALDIFPDLKDYTPARQEAILDLSYQLGKPRLSQFSSTIAAAKRGNWTTAARHLLQSEYAKQTPQRARLVARAFING